MRGIGFNERDECTEGEGGGECVWSGSGAAALNVPADLLAPCRFCCLLPDMTSPPQRLVLESRQ